jgi:hypothetical protein
MTGEKEMIKPVRSSPPSLLPYDFRPLLPAVEPLIGVYNV